MWLGKEVREASLGAGNKALEKRTFKCEMQGNGGFKPQQLNCMPDVVIFEDRKIHQIPKVDKSCFRSVTNPSFLLLPFTCFMNLLK